MWRIYSNPDAHGNERNVVKLLLGRYLLRPTKSLKSKSFRGFRPLGLHQGFALDLALTLRREPLYFQTRANLTKLLKGTEPLVWMLRKMTMSKIPPCVRIVYLTKGGNPSTSSHVPI
jgi:hypothetical protein